MNIIDDFIKNRCFNFCADYDLKGYSDITHVFNPEDAYTDISVTISFYDDLYEREASTLSVQRRIAEKITRRVKELGVFDFRTPLPPWEVNKNIYYYSKYGILPVQSDCVSINYCIMCNDASKISESTPILATPIGHGYDTDVSMYPEPHKQSGLGVLYSICQDCAMHVNYKPVGIDRLFLHECELCNDDFYSSIDLGNHPVQCLPCYYENRGSFCTDSIKITPKCICCNRIEVLPTLISSKYVFGKLYHLCKDCQHNDHIILNGAIHLSVNDKLVSVKIVKGKKVTIFHDHNNFQLAILKSEYEF